MTGWRGFKKPDNSSRIVANGLHVVYLARGAKVIVS
jgi:hypothetical protein